MLESLSTVGQRALAAGLSDARLFEWAVFLGVVLSLTAIDLSLLRRDPKPLALGRALTLSLIWVAIGLAFGVFVWTDMGQRAGVEYYTGYLIEKALAVDNIFVFVVIFRSLKIPEAYQHRVLRFGILSALVMRAVMIFAGTAALHRFEWIAYLFGAFLVFTGAKLFFPDPKPLDPQGVDGKRSSSPTAPSGAVEVEEVGSEPKPVAWVRRHVPVTPELHGHRFFVRSDGKLFATPLLLALILIEVSDIVFAVDSIPAIFGVTRDPYLVLTSNMFAILGLRALYFVVAAALTKLEYLQYGLGAVLVFVGVKMLAERWVHVSTEVNLLVIATLLAGSTLASVWHRDRSRSADRGDFQAND